MTVVRNRTLIVEDEPTIRLNIRRFLEAHGYQVGEAETCQEAIGVFRASRPDVVISDYLLQDGNALDLLLHLKGGDPNIPFIILTGHGSVDLAVQAIKAGADQFLTKPVDLPSLVILLQGLLEDRRNRKKKPVGKSEQVRPVIDPFLGTSPAIHRLAQKAKKLLFTESPVLIQGETGTGKSVLAVWLHKNGPRGEEPFIDLNCAALSRELLETDLFGHERGSFTGAVTTKMGLFEVAHGGTIFLDEIGDMDMQVQPKLLKALEEKRFRRLGDVRERQVDVRLITATHKDLSLLVQENKFRSDLYFRINTLPLRLPPLRERVEDIPILARHLLKELAAGLGCRDLVLSTDMERALQTYPWRGNIRELRNVLERAVLLSEGPILTPKGLYFEHLLEVTPGNDNQVITLSELERRHIEQVLRIEHGRVEEAAKRLDLSRSALYEKIRKHGIKLSKLPAHES